MNPEKFFYYDRPLLADEDFCLCFDMQKISERTKETGTYCSITKCIPLIDDTPGMRHKLLILSGKGMISSSWCSKGIDMQVLEVLSSL